MSERNLVVGWLNLYTSEQRMWAESIGLSARGSRPAMEWNEEVLLRTKQLGKLSDLARYIAVKLKEHRE